MSEKLTTLIFGSIFNQKIKPNTLPENLTTVTFGRYFDQKIDSNSLPENLTTVTFGRKFNQKIDSEMSPSNLKNINFNWIYLDKNIPNYIEMVNNIPNYYHVVIFLVMKNLNGQSTLSTIKKTNGHRIYMKSKIHTHIQFMVLLQY